MTASTAYTNAAGSAIPVGGSDGTIPHSPDVDRSDSRYSRAAMTAVKSSLLALSLAVVAALTLAAPASAHRNSCHTKRACPSDHHTYRWSAKRLLCTSYKAERVASDKIRVVYAGRVYWCHK